MKNLLVIRKGLHSDSKFSFGKHKKPYPLWSILLADFLILAVSLCSFAYFHHIRRLWGDNGEDLPLMGITRPEDDPKDFSVRFPAGTFASPGDEMVSSTVYRSEDISLTVKEVNYTYTSSSGATRKMQYYVYDIYVRYVENLYSSVSKNRKPFETLVENSATLKNAEGIPFTKGVCIAAVNDDYWGNANHTLVAVRNGNVLRTTDRIESDLCVLYYDGTMEMFTPETYDWESILEKRPYQIWNFGPNLLDADGEALSEFDPSSYDRHVVGNRNPRTAIGYYEPGHYCFVVVDGRSADADGATMAQLAEIMEDLGCTSAYNLDGGGSTLAYYNGDMIRVVEGEEKQRSLFGIVCVGEIR